MVNVQSRSMGEGEAFTSLQKLFRGEAAEGRARRMAQPPEADLRHDGARGTRPRESQFQPEAPADQPSDKTQVAWWDFAPVSQDAHHPANGADVSLYVARTAGYGTLNAQAQTQFFLGLLKTQVSHPLSVEVQGSGGDYATVLTALGRALAVASRRPAIDLLFSGGRLAKSATGQLADFLRAQPNRVAACRVEDGVEKQTPNWARKDVVDAYVQGLRDTLKLAKQVGVPVRNVVIDDHLSILPDDMAQYIRLNGFKSPWEATQSISLALVAVLQAARHTGADTVLSLKGSFASARQTGVDPVDVAARGGPIGTLQFQLYRDSPEKLQRALDEVEQDLSRNLAVFAQLQSVSIALTHRVGGRDIGADLPQMRRQVQAFGKRIEALWRARGLTPPTLQTSMWTFASCYRRCPLNRFGF